MKYPKKLVKRADEILAARRWDAERRQAHTLALLHEQHPEVEEARRLLNGLYAKRPSSSRTPWRALTRRSASGGSSYRP